MSTKRYGEPAARRKRELGPNGRFLCSCGCGREAQPPRKTWYSQECIDEYLVRKDGAHLRAKTFERDQGICAACGIDAEKIQRRRRRVLRKLTDAPVTSCLARMSGKDPKRIWGRDKFGVTGIEELNRRYAVRGWPKDPDQSHWEADHIVEVVKGGGACGLDNIQTLCRPCHLVKTRKLHRERAEARKAQLKLI